MAGLLLGERQALNHLLVPPDFRSRARETRERTRRGKEARSLAGSPHPASSQSMIEWNVSWRTSTLVAVMSPWMNRR